MPPPKGNDPPPRIQIQDVQPVLDCGRWPVKRSVVDAVEVTATIFRDGHDVLGAAVRYKATTARTWQESRLEAPGHRRVRALVLSAGGVDGPRRVVPGRATAQGRGGAGRPERRARRGRGAARSR